MTFDLAVPTLVALLLGAARSAAWLVVAPPFNTRVIPSKVKGVLAVALALPMVPRLTPTVPDITTGALIGAVVVQVVVGAALGYLTLLVFAAIQAAGDFIDLFGGFTSVQAFDPLSMAGASVFGRLHGLLATTLLFTTNLHLVVINGFLSSYDALPLDGLLDLDRLGPVLVAGIGQFFMSAVQIAAPLIGVLFLTDLGLGLLTRVSPSLNAFSLGFPIKILMTLSLVGLTFPLLPGALERMSDLGIDAVAAVVGG